MVYLKQNETYECIKQCDKALKKQPDNVKAIYRKAQALQQRKDYEDAIKVFKTVIDIDSENKAALQQILICKQKLSEIRMNERKRFAGMFDKLAAKQDVRLILSFYMTKKIIFHYLGLKFKNTYVKRNTV